MGAIRSAVLAVLGEADEPLRIGDTHRLVEQRLQIAVSRSTVKDVLTKAARDPTQPVIRLRRGLYALIKR
jgi:hypothetical protein